MPQFVVALDPSHFCCVNWKNHLSTETFDKCDYFLPLTMLKFGKRETKHRAREMATLSCTEHCAVSDEKRRWCTLVVDTLMCISSPLFPVSFEQQWTLINDWFNHQQQHYHSCCPQSTPQFATTPVEVDDIQTSESENVHRRHLLPVLLCQGNKYSSTGCIHQVHYNWISNVNTIEKKQIERDEQKTEQTERSAVWWW